MEGSDLDLLKDIPGFKAIVRAVLKSQMKQLVEHLSEHGGEEALLFTTSVSDGTFHYIGSTAAKGFLDGRQDIKSQFIGHCMKGGQDTEVPNVHAEGVVQASSDKSPPFIVSKTSPNVVTYTSRRSSRAVTLPLRYMSSDNSPVKQKGVGETTETETDNLQTSRSKAGSKVSSPKGRGKKSRKRPSATVTSETPVKRSAIEGTITKTLDALSTGQEQAVGDSIKIENNFSDPDNAEIDDLNSSGTLSLDHGREPSLDTSTNIKDGPNNDHEPNVLEHSGPDFQIKIEPADNDSGDNEDHTDDIDVGVNPGQDTTTGTGPSAEANTRPSTSSVCRYCGKVYNSTSGLHSHEASHRGIAPYMCCGKRFYSPANYMRHRCNKHGAQKLYKCECGCRKSFATNADLQRHQRRHTQRVKCTTCGTVLKDREHLRDHMDKHDDIKRHVCECGKNFRYLSNLSRHKKICGKK